jgi:hypothetical protein
MSDKKVKWFSFPFVAPRGKGSHPEPAESEIVEIDPPPGEPPRRCAYDDPFRWTPEQRRERIVELLAIGYSRLKAEQRKNGSTDCAPT